MFTSSPRIPLSGTGQATVLNLPDTWLPDGIG
jgi:hypothetical protein